MARLGPVCHCRHNYLSGQYGSLLLKLALMHIGNRQFYPQAVNPNSPVLSPSQVPGFGVTVTVPPAATEDATALPLSARPPRKPGGDGMGPTDGSTVLVPGARASKVRLRG